MHWGNLLLAWWNNWEDLKAGLATVVYEILNLFPRLFYNIWKMLAVVVNGIENIFRRLAGIDVGTTDIVSEIINSDQVTAIFGNLVGVSTALIVFFTIVKIIQDHYKDPNGGNPYKVVLKTFKGLLMFFFVHAAVVVGLYASGVVFRGLDAATNSGSASIAGHIFQTMAAPANRKLVGRTADEDSSWFAAAYNRYANRLNGSTDPDDGKYFITVVQDKSENIGASNLTKKELADLYIKAFPSLQYGVVNKDDTSVTPVAQWLKTEGNNLFDVDSWKNQYNDTTKADWDFDDGRIGDTVGYQSDILRSFTLSIQPSIDLTWSPIDIDKYLYQLGQDYYTEHNINIMVMGTGTEIFSGTYFYKYKQPVITEEPLGDTAKKFGITLHAGVSLQDGAACADFSLETFDVTKFEAILKAIIVNVLYTNVMTRFMQIIPSFPAVSHVGPLAVNYVQLVAPIVADFLEELVVNVFQQLIPVETDKDGVPILNEYGQTKPMVEVFSQGNKDHNGGIWSTMNVTSTTLDTTIEQYRIDGNFDELWGQLTQNIDNIRDQMSQTYDNALPLMDDAARGIGEISQRIMQQNQTWQAYKGKLDAYNNLAANSLTELGNLFKIWNLARSSDNLEGRNTYVREHGNGYTGDFTKLEEDIVSTWNELASSYRSNIRNQKPRNSYADVRVVPSIYKPIIEADTTTLSDAQKVWNFLTGTAKVNLLISNGKAYRIIDWSAYSGLTIPNYQNFDLLKNTYDLVLINGRYNGVAPTGSSAAVKSNEIDSLPCMDVSVGKDLQGNDLTEWDQQGGIKYFIDGSIGGDNNFKKCVASENSGNSNLERHQGYWGSDGVHVLDNGDDHKFLLVFNGTSLAPLNDGKPSHTINGRNATDSQGGEGSGSGASVSTASTITRASSASGNYLSAMASQNEQINALTTKSATSTPLENEFSKHIIRFRKLGTADDAQTDNDIRALESWINEEPSAMPRGNNHKEYMLHGMEAKDIDSWMASNNGDARRYLMLTTKGQIYSEKDGKYNWGDYVGQMSWKDSKTVNALYDFMSMNFVVGFIAIIAAAGVYLNFALGLIQRAVNMAVLYIMSPITISFYPFDDGKKFSGNFVMPFYKEAISAYAVIISLNIFIVLMTPLEDAVNAAVEGFGWLALIAFVGMLPSIRDSIVGILGAGQLKSKSFADAFKDFTGTMKQPFAQTFGEGKKILKKGVHGAAALRGAIDRFQGRKKARQEEEISRLAKLRESKQLGWWGAKRLEKLEGAKKTQERLDAVHEKLKTVTDAATREKMIEESNLSESQKRRIRRQQDAANKKAKKNLAARGINASSANYDEEFAKEKDALLKNEDFKKSVNSTVVEKVAKGVASAPFKLAAAPFKIAGETAKALGTAAKTVGHVLTESEVGSGLIYRAKNSLLGDMIGAKWGKDGTIRQNKDSAISELWNWLDEPARAEAMAKSGEAFNEQLKKKHAMDKKSSQIENIVGSRSVEANELKKESVNNTVARETVANLNIDQKYVELKTEEYIKKGKSETDARKLAVAHSNGFVSVNDMLDEYNKLGGDAELIKGVAHGWKGLSITMDQAKLQAADKAFMEATTLSDAEIDRKIAEAKSFNSKDGDAEAARLNKVKEYNAKMEKIRTEYRDKIGAYVPMEKAAELFEYTKKVYDSDLNSSDTESLGYKQNKIMQDFAAQGKDVNGDECRVAMENCAREMKAKLSQMQDQFTQENSWDLFRWDATKDVYDKRNAAEKIGLAEEKLNQRNFVMRAMSEFARQLLFKDEKIRNMHLNDGDYAGAARDMLRLLDAIEKHDFATASALGFDETTVKQLIDWELNGKTEELSSIKKMAMWDASNMGSVLDDMRDHGLKGAENILRNMVSLSEAQENIEKFKAVISGNSDNENHLRAKIDEELSKITTDFDSSQFDELLSGAFGQIKDIHGKVITKTEDFVAALQEMLNDVNNSGKKTAEIQQMMDAMNAMGSKYSSDINLSKKISGFTDAIANAIAAGKAFDNVQQTRALMSKTQNAIAEIMKKLGVSEQGN